MTDALFVSDRGNGFSQAFEDMGFACHQLMPGALGSPFCMPCKLLIIPSGFADSKYYKILKPVENNADKIRQFVEHGGVLLVFGAILDNYKYDWLPMKLSYQMKFKEAEVKLTDPSDPAASFIAQGKLYCDGYFTEHDGNVVMENADGFPVLITKKVGDGYIVAVSLHQLPSKQFLEWACPKGKKEFNI